MGESHHAGLGSNQIIGFFLGIGLVFATFAVVAWRKRHDKIARRETPPQRTKILRPAGYSLSCRIDELDETFNLWVPYAIAGGGVLGLAVSVLYPFAEGLVLRRFTLAEIRHGLPGELLFSILAFAIASLAWTIASVIKVFQIQGKIRDYRFGLRGEQAVAEALGSSAVVAAGYVTFHDVPGDGPWNIDHVVIGPGGVFVLETKARARRKAIRDQPEHEVLFDGQNLQFPWCNDREAVPQADRNQRWIERFLTGFAPPGIVVNSVVVVPGWFVKTNGDHAIKVMNAKYLVTYLTSFPKRFAAEQLQPIVRALEERCRGLEF